MSPYWSPSKTDRRAELFAETRKLDVHLERGPKKLCVISPRALAEAFYFEVWNRADEERAREILAESFRFRGSLGAERVGPDGFVAYMRDVHRALGNYRCIIDELVTDGDRAAARMRFTGEHRAEFLGVAATGRPITWAGAAFFRCEGGRISDLWVLGDLVEFRRQLTT